jgi:hypothetical protein
MKFLFIKKLTNLFILYIYFTVNTFIFSAIGSATDYIITQVFICLITQ